MRSYLPYLSGKEIRRLDVSRSLDEAFGFWHASNVMFLHAFASFASCPSRRHADADAETGGGHAQEHGPPWARDGRFLLLSTSGPCLELELSDVLNIYSKDNSDGIGPRQAAAARH